MLKKSLLALALMGAAAAANASAELVQNGSFEADSQAVNTWSIYPNLTNWTGIKEIELRNNVQGSAADGVNFVELDARNNNGMSQVINGTAVGQQYTFSFQFRDRPDAGNPATYGLEAWIDNVLVASVGSVGNVWQTFSAVINGTGSPMTLKFVATGSSDSYGTSLDNVSLKAVPVPAAVWLFGTGIFGLLGLGKRKAII